MLDGRQAQQALNTYNFAVVSMLKFSLFALVEARVARAFQRGLLGKTWNFLEITCSHMAHESRAQLPARTASAIWSER